MPMEKTTLVVTVRDRFSTTQRCLDALLKHTELPYDLLVVFGGTPPGMQADLTTRYGDKAQFTFQEGLMNPAQSRNLGLRMAKTRLAVLIDNDVYVRPGWLESLVRCQQETGAAMVVPIVLETEHVIHTAGNDLLITHKDGVAYAQKVLRYCKQELYEDSNLKRCPTDYGELHCQLVDVEAALRSEVFDERLREAGEVDSGLSWAKGGCSMWFEPASTVFFDFPGRIDQVEDIRPFIFKWDMDAIREGYDYFRNKWDLDITECGHWIEYNTHLNNKLGLLSRLWPSKAALAVDNASYACRRVFSWPVVLWRRFKNRLFGYDRWKRNIKKGESA